MRLFKRIYSHILKNRNPGLIHVGNDVNIRFSQFEGYNAVHSKVTIHHCSVGLCSYIGENSRFLYTKIGRYCSIADNVNIPVIASGGAGTVEHFYDAFEKGHADAALAASLFHFKELEISEVKKYLSEKNIPVRNTYGSTFQ